MNDCRLAVERLDDNTREEFIRLELASIRVAPLRQDQRPSPVSCGLPIHGESAQIEPGIETHDERLGLNREPDNFLDKLGAGIKAQTVAAVVSRFRLRGSCVFAKHMQFFRAESIIVKD